MPHERMVAESLVRGDFWLSQRELRGLLDFHPLIVALCEPRCCLGKDLGLFRSVGRTESGFTHQGSGKRGKIEQWFRHGIPFRPLRGRHVLHASGVTANRGPSRATYPSVTANSAPPLDREASRAVSAGKLAGRAAARGTMLPALTRRR